MAFFIYYTTKQKHVQGQMKKKYIYLYIYNSGVATVYILGRFFFIIIFLTRIIYFFLEYAVR